MFGEERNLKGFGGSFSLFSHLRFNKACRHSPLLDYLVHNNFKVDWRGNS